MEDIEKYKILYEEFRSNITDYVIRNPDQNDFIVFLHDDYKLGFKSEAGSYYLINSDLVEVKDIKLELEDYMPMKTTYTGIGGNKFILMWNRRIPVGTIIIYGRAV